MINLLLVKVPDKRMNQTTKNKNSRTAILNKLRQVAPPFFRDEDPVEKGGTGGVFPKIQDLLFSFQLELETLGGEVFLCGGSAVQMQKLADLQNERGWQTFTVSDPGIRNRLETFGTGSREVDPVLEEVEAGVTNCEVLVALTGGVMVSSSGGSGRRMNIFPSVHIVLTQKSQLVESIQDAFDVIATKYSSPPSQISLISGPSRTADIEKTLVMGAHGPKELIVLVDTEN
jgi:L-lactate dehydrogenase complex protein LldG